MTQAPVLRCVAMALRRLLLSPAAGASEEEYVLTFAPRDARELAESADLSTVPLRYEVRTRRGDAHVETKRTPRALLVFFFRSSSPRRPLPTVGSSFSSTAAKLEITPEITP